MKASTSSLSTTVVVMHCCADTKYLQHQSTAWKLVWTVFIRNCEVGLRAELLELEAISLNCWKIRNRGDIVKRRERDAGIISSNRLLQTSEPVVRKATIWPNRSQPVPAAAAPLPLPPSLPPLRASSKRRCQLLTLAGTRLRQRQLFGQFCQIWI